MLHEIRGYIASVFSLLKLAQWRTFEIEYGLIKFWRFVEKFVPVDVRVFQQNRPLAGTHTAVSVSASLGGAPGAVYYVEEAP